MGEGKGSFSLCFNIVESGQELRHGRDLEAGADGAEAMDRMLLDDLLSLLTNRTQDHQLSDGITCNELGSSPSITNSENSLQAGPQVSSQMRKVCVKLTQI